MTTDAIENAVQKFCGKMPEDYQALVRRDMTRFLDNFDIDVDKNIDGSCGDRLTVTCKHCGKVYQTTDMIRGIKRTFTNASKHAETKHGSFGATADNMYQYYRFTFFNQRERSMRAMKRF